MIRGKNLGKTLMRYPDYLFVLMYTCHDSSGVVLVICISMFFVRFCGSWGLPFLFEHISCNKFSGTNQMLFVKVVVFLSAVIFVHSFQSDDNLYDQCSKLFESLAYHLCCVCYLFYASTIFLLCAAAIRAIVLCFQLL